MRRLFAIVIVLVFGTIPARASYERGIDALAAGNYEAAWAALLPLAEAGHADSQFSIGFMYDYGQGVARNTAEAMLWYRKAAEQDLAVAQYTLGSIYEIGLGVRRDLVEAFTWYSRAARTLDDGEARDAVLRSLDALIPELDDAQRAHLGLPVRAADQDARSGIPAPPAPAAGMEAGTAATAGHADTAIAASVPHAAGHLAVLTPKGLDPAPATNSDEAHHTPAPAPSGRDLVQAIQQALNARGLDAGAADGLAGPRTKAAIETFQRDRGLAVTGEVTTALLDALRHAGAAPTTDTEAAEGGGFVITAAWPGAVSQAMAPPDAQDHMMNSMAAPQPDEIAAIGTPDRTALVPEAPPAPEAPATARIIMAPAPVADTPSQATPVFVEIDWFPEDTTSQPPVPQMQAVPVEPVTVAALTDRLDSVPAPTAMDIRGAATQAATQAALRTLARDRQRPAITPAPPWAMPIGDTATASRSNAPEPSTETAMHPRETASAFALRMIAHTASERSAANVTPQDEPTPRTDSPAGTMSETFAAYTPSTNRDSPADTIATPDPTAMQLAVLTDARDTAVAAVTSDALFGIPRRKPAPPELIPATAETQDAARPADSPPAADPEPADPTHGLVTERLTQLDRIVAVAGSGGAVSQAWSSLEAWETETHAILESTMGAEVAARLGAQSGTLVLGDPFGSFRSVTDAYRSYLISLKAAPRS